MLASILNFSGQLKYWQPPLFIVIRVHSTKKYNFANIPAYGALEQLSGESKTPKIRINVLMGTGDNQTENK